MTQEELKEVVTKLLDKKDSKSLASTLKYVYDRWVEEQHYEDWEAYSKFMKNGLRKMTPKRTKFIGFTNNQPNQPIELTLVIHLHGCTQHCKFVVNRRGVTWSTVDMV
ncbi:MAG: hypothetical protein WCJ62_07445 [Flavobacterium sp.]